MLDFLNLFAFEIKFFTMSVFLWFMQAFSSIDSKI